MVDMSKATLVPQSYGIACAQTVFGGPKGIWLECTSCNESQVIKGSRYLDSDPYALASDEEAASVFLRYGWTGDGPKLKRAKCPKCSRGR